MIRLVLMLIFFAPLLYLVALSYASSKHSPVWNFVLDVLDLVEKYVILFLRLISHFTIPISRCVACYILIFVGSFYIYSCYHDSFREFKGVEQILDPDLKDRALSSRESMIFYFTFENMLPFSLFTDQSRLKLESPLYSSNILHKIDSLNCASVTWASECRTHNLLSLGQWDIANNQAIYEFQNDQYLLATSSCLSQQIQCEVARGKIYKDLAILLMKEDQFETLEWVLVLQKVFSGILLYIYVTGLAKMTRR